MQVTDTSLTAAINLLTEYREALAVAQWLFDNGELPQGFDSPEDMARSFTRPNREQLDALLRVIKSV